MIRMYWERRRWCTRESERNVTPSTIQTHIYLGYHLQNYHWWVWLAKSLTVMLFMYVLVISLFRIRISRWIVWNCHCQSICSVITNIIATVKLFTLFALLNGCMFVFNPHIHAPWISTQTKHFHRMEFHYDGIPYADRNVNECTCNDQRKYIHIV